MEQASRHLQRENGNARKGGSEASDIFRVTGGDDGAFELERGGHDQRIDRVSGGQLHSPKQVPGLLSYRSRQLEHANARVVQQVMDGRVGPRATTDLGEDRRWNPNECPLFVGEAEPRRGSVGQDPALRRISKSVERPPRRRALRRFATRARRTARRRSAWFRSGRPTCVR